MTHDRFVILTPESFGALTGGEEIWVLPEGAASSARGPFLKAKVHRWNDEGTGVIVVLDEKPASGKAAFLITKPTRLARLTDGHVPRRHDWLNERPHP